MGGGDCPMDNELAIAAFLPLSASAADIPSSSNSPPPPHHHHHHIHTFKCHLKIKHKRHKPCMKLKHKHTDILIGHQFPPHHSRSHSHSHSPPHHHHHDRGHKKKHHHHGQLYSHGHHPFAAHPMAIHMGMPGSPPHHHH